MYRLQEFSHASSTTWRLLQAYSETPFEASAEAGYRTCPPWFQQSGHKATFRSNASSVLMSRIGMAEYHVAILVHLEMPP